MNFPNLPLIKSTEAYQQEKKTQFSCVHPISKNRLKLPAAMDLKKKGRSLPVGVCRSWEVLERASNMPMWPRSHSLGDLHGNIGTGSIKSVDTLPLDSSKKSTESEGGGQMIKLLMANQRKEVVDTLKGKRKEFHLSATMPSTRMFPQRLPENCDARTSSLSYGMTWTPFESCKKSTHDLGRANTSISKENVETDQKDMSEAKMLPKASSQPPPVPAKKNRERISNGHCHLPSTLSCSDVPSLPAKKATLQGSSSSHELTACRTFPDQEPKSPSSIRPPWLSDLPETASVQQHVLKLDPSSVRKISCNRGLDLEMLIENKLQSEDIDLTEEPYSDKVPENLNFANVNSLEYLFNSFHL